jgi:archaetidylinositol phosphate synthase
MLDSLFGSDPEVRRIQTGVARALAAVGIGANTATIAACIIGIVAGVAFGRGMVIWGILLLAISAALDAIDGTLAREFASPSPLGGVLDLTGDRVVETAVIVGIAWQHPALYFPALLLVGSWYVNITVFLAVGAALERRGPKLIEYPPGILERTEAMIFFAALAIVSAFGILSTLGAWLCYVMTALEIVTGAQRLIFGLRMLRALSTA